MECSRATGGRRAGEEPGRQTPIPGTGLGYSFYFPAPSPGSRLLFLPEKRGWGLSFGAAGGWQVCQQDLTHLTRKREATARCTSHSRCRHLEPAMGDISVCCELFVDLAPVGEG